MSFILDALERSARDKRLSTVDIDPVPWHWDGWPSGRRAGTALREKIKTSLAPCAKTITTGVLSLALLSAVAWASMAYFSASDSAGENTVLQTARNHVDGGMTNSTTAGSDVSPAMPENKAGPGVFLSDGMDQTGKKPVGAEREELTETTGVDYRAALFEEDVSPPATPAINSDLGAADGILLDGVFYHSMPIKRRAILHRAGEREARVVKVGDMFAGLKVAAIHESNIALIKGTESFVINLD